MKHLFSTLFVVLFATSMLAQTGLTCEDPIPVDKNYRGSVDGPCELWYTAWTYDLPLHVYFSPVSDKSTWGPEVEIDFTCEEGVYDDPKLDSLINMVDDYDVSFPLELLCDLVVRNGRNEWDLSVAKSYREQLAEFGIPYNLQAFIKVRFSEAGTISLTPDTAFTSCMDNAHFFELGDSVAIDANDMERVFVANYSDWQEDSIQFVWTGDEPAQVYLAVQECDFAPSTTNPFVWARYDVAKDAPHKVQSQEMKDAIKQHANGGLYYAKVVSPSAGKLLVEKIPMKAAQGGAQVLTLGQEIQVQEEALYCFPKTWTAAQFVASTTQPVAMYVSNTADFTASDTDANVLDVFAANQYGNEQIVYLSSVEIADLAEQATDEYIYVRFSCPASTVIAIDSWEASACAGESYMIPVNEEVRIEANNSYQVYRLRYADVQGAELKLKWSGNGTIKPYISDTCDYIFSETQYLLLNPAPNIKRRGTYTISADEVNAWASRVNADGFIYVQFNATSAGNITFAVEKPITPDPVYTTETAAICFGESFDWNGKTYTETGKYTYTTVAANGADSIVTLDLTIYPKVPVTKDTAAICYGETYPWQGAEYTASGEYSVTLQNVNGCDSVITLNLTVYPQTPATTEEVTIEFGTTYDWHGTTFTESGEYTTTLQDENGCDYEATLLLTILPEEKPEFAYPVVASSEEQLLINYPLATQVYGMEYLSWQAGDVTLAWSGATPLYVFIAKVADFAVAVHHKNVVKFIEIPAEGSVVLPKSEVQALNRYATEEGYLYVRFLTEKEGVLTTAQAE